MVALLVMQPDFGQTMLITMVWCALFFMAGMRWIWVIGLGGTAASGLAAAYFTDPHVAKRIKRFMDPASATPSISIRRWRLLNAAAGSDAGPGRAPSSAVLPESHTDFVFAVAAEEFGIVLCC